MRNIFRSAVLFLLLSVTGLLQAQTLKLSSLPDAEAVIFLDFDGHTVSGTSWNSNGPLYCGPSGLNDAKVTEVFNRVAEDFRPFNINITTDSTKFLDAPLDRRTRVIVTITSSWYPGVGGVSFMNTFTIGDDTPCFVFSAALGYNVKQVSEASSHEAGHTLGLYHQAVFDENCVRIKEYSTGQGTGEIGWAPIMGNSYSKNFTLWNIGPTPYSCTMFQNDLDVITSDLNGFGYREDDHRDHFDSASQAEFTGNQFVLGGIISQNTDNDLFKFTVPYRGEFALDAVPYNVGTGNAGSDLDLQVTLYNSAQTVLNIYNPGTLLNSVVDTTLNAGTYYMKIEGKGNQFAPSYASLGSYSLQGNISAASNPLPLRRLQLNAAQNGDLHQISWEIEADEEVIEQTLEVSTDGRNFHKLVQPSNTDRSYSYRPSTSNITQYRISVVFDNGRQHYSNVVSVRPDRSNPRPKVTGNLISSGNIYVSSPGNYSYSIFDFNGKVVKRGQLINGINNISASDLQRGMYMIRFIGDSQQWNDKLLLQ
jgi:hypothetical protein